MDARRETDIDSGRALIRNVKRLRENLLSRDFQQSNWPVSTIDLTDESSASIKESKIEKALVDRALLTWGHPRCGCAGPPQRHNDG
jgi:hypothetical protein